MSAESNPALGQNHNRLLGAGFAAIFAAGMGFAIRGGILDNWGAEFGFTGAQLGAIGGSGFSGFCFGIIVGGLIADKIGYGRLVAAAFGLHVISAVITLAAPSTNAYWWLYFGTFLFGVANGTLEAVANPLVAALFPNRRTHYLNILHAAWPAGLVVGACIGWVLDDQFQAPWKVQLALFLLPTLGYGCMFWKQSMPRSQASIQGLRLSEMYRDVGILGSAVVCYLLSLFFVGALGFSEIAGQAIAGALLLAAAFLTRFSLGSLILCALFVAHLLVGAVELGTDTWIQNITGNLFTPHEGKWLFIWTSAIMFGLRFCTPWIERHLRLSPMSLLLVCSLLASVGLVLSSRITSFSEALFALAIYAVGKTFFWPTMLATVSDRFPRTGAVAISIIGGIGMLSAGVIGGPGLGYAKDRFAGADLAQTNPAAFAEYKADATSSFMFFEPVHGLDGKKLGEIGAQIATHQSHAAAAQHPVPDPRSYLRADALAVYNSSIAGDRKTLRADACIPLLMAAIYLAILLADRAKPTRLRTAVEP